MPAGMSPRWCSCSTEMVALFGDEGGWLWICPHCDAPCLAAWEKRDCPCCDRTHKAAR